MSADAAEGIKSWLCAFCDHDICDPQKTPKIYWQVLQVVKQDVTEKMFLCEMSPMKTQPARTSLWRDRGHNDFENLRS